MNDFSEKLRSMRLEMPPWCVAPSEDLVFEYEKQFGLTLPPDYRAFLVRFGGCMVQATAPFQEPTPFGKDCLVDDFFGFMPEGRDTSDVRWNTALIEGAPDVVAIAGDVMGGLIWLKCTGRDAGCVYYHDPERRQSWSDEDFKNRFPELSADVEHYLQLRLQGRLPPKSVGYENVYRLASTFSEFISSLAPSCSEGDD